MEQRRREGRGPRGGVPAATSGKEREGGSRGQQEVSWEQREAISAGTDGEQAVREGACPTPHAPQPVP